MDSSTSHEGRPSVAAARPPAGPCGGYLFPRWARNLFLGAGLFVAYSQFVSVGLLWLCRLYPLSEDGPRGIEIDGEFVDFFFVVAWLPYFGGSIGLYERHGVAIFTLTGVVLATLGSAALIAAAAARRGWRYPRALVGAGALVGGAATYPVAVLMIFGIGGMYWGSIDGVESSFPVPVFGVPEAFGALVLPAIMHPILIVALLAGAARGWLDKRSGSVEKPRRSPR